MPSSACDWSSDVCSSDRSEEHTSELQSRSDLVCRLLLEKKNKTDATEAGLDVQLGLLALDHPVGTFLDVATVIVRSREHGPAPRRRLDLQRCNDAVRAR